MEMAPIQSPPTFSISLPTLTVPRMSQECSLILQPVSPHKLLPTFSFLFCLLSFSPSSPLSAPLPTSRLPTKCFRHWSAARYIFIRTSQENMQISPQDPLPFLIMLQNHNTKKCQGHPTLSVPCQACFIQNLIQPTGSFLAKRTWEPSRRISTTSSPELLFVVKEDLPVLLAWKALPSSLPMATPFSRCFFVVFSFSLQGWISLAGRPGWVSDLQYLSQCKMPPLFLSMPHHDYHVLVSAKNKSENIRNQIRVNRYWRTGATLSTSPPTAPPTCQLTTCSGRWAWSRWWFCCWSSCCCFWWWWWWWWWLYNSCIPPWKVSLPKVTFRGLWITGRSNMVRSIRIWCWSIRLLII